MHARPSNGQQTSQGAARHSRAAEEAQMPSSTARAHGVLEHVCRMDGAASDEVMPNQQDCSSSQKAEMVTHEPTGSGGDQQDWMLQEAPPGATSAPAAAEGMRVSQPQGHSAPRDGPKADSTSAEVAPVSCAPQASCKGKENSDRQQQQHWRKKRTLAQTAHHSVPPHRGPEPESGPAASKASQRTVAVSPDVVDLSEDAPVSTGVANGTAEDAASQGQHAVSGWQPTSSQKEMQCAEDAKNRLDATMSETAHDSGASAVPADAQAADIGGHQEHHMQPSTVQESEDEDIDVGQIDGPAEEHVCGEQNIVMTEAAVMGTAPQTLLQTCVLGTVPNTACAAIPATAIEPLLLSAGAPAQTQVGSVMPQADKAGAHQQGQPLGMRAPVSESDVQVRNAYLCRMSLCLDLFLGCQAWRC